MELNKTIQHFFHQPHLDVVDIDEIRRATERYPYVGALQLLLLKKQQQLKLSQTDDQYAKAALFVPNIYQIDSVLRDRPVHENFTSPFVRELVPVQEKEEPKVEPERSTVEPGYEIENAQSHSEEVEEVQVKELEQLLEMEPIKEDETEIAPEPYLEEGKESEEFSKEQHDDTPEPPLRTDLLRMESPIPIPSLRDISPRTDEMPVFEPYHTIDYFASQGIKLGQDVKPGDKLGKQLKSFTEWIRTMKRLPNTEMEQQLLDTSNGENIVAMAAGSVEMKEVVTETMAEVLLKQGNKARAIDIYRKLSLAYPDKSAYFAARIENIKHR
ncbi:hypothetical protein [Flavihumibacter sp. ZG627]|uniref:hypothetical protein n=1 Tax=Flavihumibacter sp. ZG627 TaxID=1463156 RepID=UPI000693ACB8|nr:hypothetical protein [Flavihumibacter sp. ZG627]